MAIKAALVSESLSVFDKLKELIKDFEVVQLVKTVLKY